MDIGDANGVLERHEQAALEEQVRPIRLPFLSLVIRCFTEHKALAGL
jgi:hypothetical protein